jgi:hypothetical protein
VRVFLFLRTNRGAIAHIRRAKDQSGKKDRSRGLALMRLCERLVAAERRH